MTFCTAWYSTIFYALCKLALTWNPFQAVKGSDVNYWYACMLMKWPFLTQKNKVKVKLLFIISLITIFYNNNQHFFISLISKKLLQVLCDLIIFAFIFFTATIGGWLGLAFGASIITFIEFFAFTLALAKIVLNNKWTKK